MCVCVSQPWLSGNNNLLQSVQKLRFGTLAIFGLGGSEARWGPFHVAISCG